MRGYLVDTNHLRHAIGTAFPVRNRLKAAYESGWRIGTSMPVLCELTSSILSSSRRDALQRGFTQLQRDVLRIWPLTIEIAYEFGETFLKLRRTGRSLSQVDIMLAAIARVMKVTILTTDRDFEALPDIPTENLLATSP